jgi:CBS domain containing-hemolysin-like protein
MHPRPENSRKTGADIIAPIRTVIGLLLCLSTQTAHASFLSGEAMDKAADVIALVVLVIVPIIGIAVFWLVHILPEKVAEQREHPQKDAIKALCLLSLVFGGLLWPFAWVLAYSKPVLYKLAYGRDKHEDFYRHLAEADGAEARVLGDDVARLRSELDALAARAKLPDELLTIREQLRALEANLAVPTTKDGAG